MARLIAMMAMTTAMLASGCATHGDRVQEIRSAYYSGRIDTASAKIDTAIQKNKSEADVLKLDQATILLSQGKAKEAEALFREVRDNFEAKEGKDIAEGVKSMLTDDRQLAYAGEDYEKVLIRFMLSLSSLLGDGSDATAYALQVTQKQQQIIDNSKSLSGDGKNLKANYKLVPAGAYLHAALREETHTNYDDVARSLELVAKWKPDFPAIKQDLERAKHGSHSQPGHGVVYIFTLVGRGPYKEEKMEIASTAALLIADRLITALGKQSLPPTIAPIKIPVVVRPYNEIAKVSVAADGRAVGQTATITDVGLMATEQCEAVMPETLARAVVRRVVKKGAVYGVKEAIGTNKGSLTSLGMDAAGVAWEALEVADTRCWGLLPDKIQVLRLELPVGEHQLTLQPLTGDAVNLGQPESVKIQIQDGRNSYVMANFPNSKLAGRIVTK
ncbi:MAG: hypothetical protein K8U57_09770 [Planctomycetes bacterium]|nr:hypothetical protein [Planctomycetota bacterium]